MEAPPLGVISSLLFGRSSPKSGCEMGSHLPATPFFATTKILYFTDFIEWTNTSKAENEEIHYSSRVF